MLHADVAAMESTDSFFTGFSTGSPSLDSSGRPQPDASPMMPARVNASATPRVRRRQIDLPRAIAIKICMVAKCVLLQRSIEVDLAIRCAKASFQTRIVAKISRGRTYRREGVEHIVFSARSSARSSTCPPIGVRRIAIREISSSTSFPSADDDELQIPRPKGTRGIQPPDPGRCG